MVNLRWMFWGACAAGLAACQPAAEESAAHEVSETHEEHDDERHVVLEETGHAGGIAHEHGAGEMVVVVSDGVTVSLRAPVASFGLPESGEEVTLGEGVGSSLFTLPKVAGCDVMRETIGGTRADGHAELTVTIDYNCDAPEKLENVRFNGFSHDDGLAFEDVDAVFISSDGQSAAELTSSDPVIKRP